MLTSISLLDLNPILEPILISELIEFEHEPPILDSYILLLGNVCELQSYDLDQTHELTPTLKSKLDLSLIPESVSVPIPFIIEFKSFIPQNHIPLLDEGLDQYDSMMIFKIGHITRKNFMLGSCMILFILGSIKLLIRKRS